MFFISHIMKYHLKQVFIKPKIKISNDEDDVSLENYFENQDDMKVYCSQIAGKRCIKHNIKNNGNYYKLAKLQFFKNATTTISQLVQYCQDFVTTNQWKFEMEFTNGMISSLILFPPWSSHLFKILSQSTDCRCDFYM